MRSQSSIGRQFLHRGTKRTIARRDQEPDGSQWPDASDALEPGRRCCPQWIKGKGRIELGLHLDTLFGPGLYEVFHARMHSGHHGWTVCQGMQVMTDLLTHLHEALPFCQPLREFDENCRRGMPHGGLKQSGQLCHRLGSNGIRLRSFEQRFGTMVSLRECRSQGHPLRTSGFHDNQDRLRCMAYGQQALPKQAEPLWCLLNREGTRGSLLGSHPGD